MLKSIIYKKLKNERGDSIVESLVAIALTVTIFVGIMGIEVENLREAKFNEASSIAGDFAQYILLQGRAQYIDNGLYDWNGCYTPKLTTSEVPVPPTDFTPTGTAQYINGVKITKATFTISRLPITLSSDCSSSGDCQVETEAQVTWELYGITQTVTQDTSISNFISSCGI